MKRLKKLSNEDALGEKLDKEKQINLEAARKSIESINISIQNIMEENKNLFEKLNTISEEYPKLYDELKKLIRFPTEYDTRDIVQMEEDLKKVEERYRDDDYLSEVMGLI